MNRFIEKVTLAKLDGTIIRMLDHFERQKLITVDDFGLQPLSQEVKLALLQIFEERYAKRSVIITSQLPISAWLSYLNVATIADALLDRLTAREHRVELKGDSRRKIKSVD